MITIERAATIKGWMSIEELLWLAARAEESVRILEIGSLRGRSARALADNTKGKVICVDPWGMKPYYKDDGSILEGFNTDVLEDFKVNLADHILTGKLMFYQGTVDELPRNLIFDFIFIDGDHRYEAVRHDIIYAFQHVFPGGIVSGHDYTYAEWPGVKKAVDEMIPNVETKGALWWKRF